MQTLPIASLRRIEAICSRFEEDSADVSQPIAPLLGQVGNDEREHLLRELIAVDVELRIARNESPKVLEYEDLGKLCDPAMTSHAIAAALDEARDAVDPRPQSSRYDFIEKVGSGGNGDVWRIYDRESRRSLAIKLLRDRLRGDQAAEQRLMRESLLTGTLQHPGIPPIYDRGKLDDGTSFFSMKLVGGETFANILKASSGRQHHDSLIRHLGIFEQLAQTVAYAHAQGVIHRDLKPHNVMVGDFGEVQVMDWGMAKQVMPNDVRANEDRANLSTRSLPQSTLDTLPASQDDSWENVNQSLTAAGDLMGTPAYMSPEQARGEVKTLDVRSDVFSLGAILFEILTGQRLHEGQSIGTSLLRTATGTLDNAIEWLQICEAHQDLRSLCECCLRFESGQRPKDAGVIASAITAYLAGAERRARQTELKQREATIRATEDRRRRRLQTQTAVAIALVSVIGSGVAISQWRQATRANAQAEDALALADERFDQAKSVVDEFFTEVADEDGLLATAPGAQPVRRKLLTKARDYYETFLAESDNDPERKLNVARAYARLGEIEMVMNPGGEELVRYQNKVIEICDTMLDQSAESLDFLEARAKAYRAMGAKHSFSEQYAEALRMFEQAQPDFEQLVAVRGNVNDQFELAKLYQNLGRTTYHLRDFERSEAFLAEAIKVGTEIQQSDLDNAEYAMQLAQMHSSAGILFGWGMKEWQRCDVSFHAAYDLIKTACELNPELVSYRRELARNQMNFAMSCTHMKKFEEAEKEFRDCIATYDQLVIENPTVTDLLHGAALAASNFCTFLWRRNNLEACADFARKSYEGYRQLAEQNPSIQHYRDNELNMLGVSIARDYEIAVADGISVGEAIARSLPGVQTLADRNSHYAQQYPDNVGYTIDRAYWSALLPDQPRAPLLEWTKTVRTVPKVVSATLRTRILARALALIRNDQHQDAIAWLDQLEKKDRTAPCFLVECLAKIPSDPIAAKTSLEAAEVERKLAKEEGIETYLLIAEAKRLLEKEPK